MNYPENYDEIMQAGLDLDAIVEAVEKAKAIAMRRFGSLPVLVGLPSNITAAVDLAARRLNRNIVDKSEANMMFLRHERLKYGAINLVGTIQGVPLTFVFNASTGFVLLRQTNPELPLPPKDPDLIYPVPLLPLRRAESVQSDK